MPTLIDDITKAGQEEYDSECFTIEGMTGLLEGLNGTVIHPDSEESRSLEALSETLEEITNNWVFKSLSFVCDKVEGHKERKKKEQAIIMKRVAINKAKREASKAKRKRIWDLGFYFQDDTPYW